MAGQPIHPEPELTEFAKIYGEDNHGMLRGTKKSGYTPQEPLLPDAAPMSVEEWYQRKLIESQQKKKLFGFTARELKAMGAFARFESPQPCNLQDVFHPIFWTWESSNDTMRRHNPIIPLGRGRPGYWELHNPLILPVMRPVVRLASQFIEMYDVWSWWDTVAFGQLKRVDKSLTPSNKEHFYRLIPRNPYLVQEERELVRKRFAEFALVVQWGITDGTIDPLSNLAFESKWQGLTTTDLINYGGARCYVDIGRVEVLMRTDLPAGERFLLESSLAKTMVHELGHAWWKFREPNVPIEPYFDNELTSELGYSLVNAIFGGRDTYATPEGNLFAASNFSYGDRERELIGFQTPYPSVFDIVPSPPALGMVDSMRYHDFFPIPARYFERVQQRDFWEYHVRIFGAKSLRWGPLVYGRRVKSPWIPNAPDLYDQEPITLDRLEGETVGAAKIENMRRLNASAIRRALSDTVGSEILQDEFQLDRLVENDPRNELTQYLRARFTLDHIHWANDLGRVVPDAVDETEVIIEPDRFLEIADFLIRNQGILAIDTMTTPIAEVAFLGHINRLGGNTGEISLTPEELREFLIYVEYQKIMLYWDPSGIGEVSRRSNGWGFGPPVDPKTPPIAPQTPPQKHLEIMAEHVKGFIGMYELAVDIDDDYLLRLLNYHPQANLTKADYNRLITYLDFKKKYFIRGPPGIARFILAEEEVEEIKEKNTEILQRDRDEMKQKLAAARKRNAKYKRRRDQVEQEDKELTDAWKKKRDSIMKKLEPSFIRAIMQDDEPLEPEPKRRKLDGSSQEAQPKAKEKDEEKEESGLPPIAKLTVDDPNDDDGPEDKCDVAASAKKKDKADDDVETADDGDGAQEEDVLVFSP